MKKIICEYMDIEDIFLYKWNWLGSQKNPVQTARTLWTRNWRKLSKESKQVFSVKGKKEGTAGHMARFFVAISYGKGVIESHQYEEIRMKFQICYREGVTTVENYSYKMETLLKIAEKSRDTFDSIHCFIYKIPLGLSIWMS